jgi:AcrR family transcriptional regulator
MTTKERILDVTTELFRRHGYNGTGLKQIVASANAPFGSVYHFFPGGKEELGEAVIRRAGQMYLELIEAIWDAAGDPLTGVSDIFMGAAAALIETDYIDLCPIGTVALEMASSSEVLRKATSDVFESWIHNGAARLEQAGADPAKAREVALALVAILQGAFVLGRAMRSPEPVEAAGRAAAAIAARALSENKQRSDSAAPRVDAAPPDRGTGPAPIPLRGPIAIRPAVAP